MADKKLDSKTRIKDYIQKNFPKWERVDYSKFCDEEIEFDQNLSELYKIVNDEIVLISYTNISITGTDRPKPQLRVFLDEYKKPFYFAKKYQLRYYLFSIFTKDDDMARGLDNFNPKEYIISIETNLDTEGARRDLRSIYDYANEKLNGSHFLKCSRSNYKAEINQASFIYIGSEQTPDTTTFENFINIFDSRPYLNSTNDYINKKNTISQSVEFQDPDFPLQQIFYGAPGTGKSFSIKSVIAEHMSIDVDQVDMEADNIFRTTFHPDYDYAQFVGCYKPTKEKNGDITYDFVPQVFVNALVEAYGGVQPAKSSSNTSATTDQVADGETKKDDLNEEETVVEQTVESEVETQAVKPVYLVIEEINRGNCAQIFGDIFQLLDRNANGESEYSISVDKDLREYLEINCPNAICNGKIKIPANLSIIATMNTSDQSLFPMDSAFKRRWEWVHVPIKNQNFDKDGNQVHFKIVVEKGKYEYDWNEFQNAVNIEIQNKTHSEDKQMGDYFIKKDVSLDEFINKVMFYLWNDVCKENYQTEDNFFRTEDESTEEETEFSFGEMMADKVNKINGFMRKLKVKNLIETSESTDASDVSTPESSAE